MNQTVWVNVLCIATAAAGLMAAYLLARLTARRAPEQDRPAKMKQYAAGAIGGALGMQIGGMVADGVLRILRADQLASSPAGPGPTADQILNQIIFFSCTGMLLGLIGSAILASIVARTKYRNVRDSWKIALLGGFLGGVSFVLLAPFLVFNS